MGSRYSRAARWAIAGLLALTAASRAAEAPLTGEPAWARLVGNTAAGTTPDGPFAEYFAPDGSLTLLDGDGKAAGRWALRDGRLCTTMDDEEECRSLEVTGAAGAFLDDGGARYPFAILDGNPKGL